MSIRQTPNIGCLLLLLLAPGVSRAQPPKTLGSGFGISPPRLSVRVVPGSRSVASFTLQNAGSRRLGRYTIEVSDLGQDESGSVRPVPMGQGVRSCASWIKVPVEIVVPPDSSRKVGVTIQCPSGVIGAYYAVLSVAVAQAPQEKGMVVALRPTIGVTLEVIVPSPAPSHLETKEVVYEPGNGSASPSLLLRIENTGVWKKAVEGDVLVYDRPGQFPVRAAIPYRSSGTPFEAFPGMTLALRCQLPRKLEPGKSHVSVRLQLTRSAQARKEFELEVPIGASGAKTVRGQAGEKSELDVSLVVEPDLIEVVIPPGGKRILPVRIRSEDSRETRVRAHIAEARMEPNGMVTYPEAGRISRSAWLTVVPETLSLASRRMATLQVEAAVPRGDSNGLPLVGVVRLQGEAAPSLDNADWLSGGDFAVFVVATAPNAPPASLKTVSFNLTRASPEQNPSAVVLRLRNIGGRVARASGRIHLTRATGQEIAYMDIGASGPELVLPGAEREFRMEVPPLDKGEFKVSADISPTSKGGEPARAELTFKTKTAIPEGLRD